MIEDYFGDGQKFGCQIRYLKEKKYLHTGGSLSLIREKIKEPLIVMNGDLVTRINFAHFLDFHQKGKFVATLGVKPYTLTIPFGVIREKKNRLISLTEKPINSFLINAGIYILNPEILKIIPKNQVFPLTKLFEKLLSRKKYTNKIGVYQMKEDWIDVGRLQELIKAQEELLSFEEKCLKNSKKF
jgi:NDP-sugar pyrophosphorylase family protein